MGEKIGFLGAMTERIISSDGTVMPVIKKHGELSGVYSSETPFLNIVVKAQYNSNMVRARARIDTGATVSCITKQLAKKLGAPVYDEASLLTIGDSVSVNTYMIDLHLSDSMQINHVNAFEASLTSIHDTDIIIGMDLISLGDLSVFKDGTFTFTI